VIPLQNPRSTFQLSRDKDSSFEAKLSLPKSPIDRNLEISNFQKHRLANSKKSAFEKISSRDLTTLETQLPALEAL